MAKIRSSEAPSIRAASSSSPGSPMKKARMTTMLNGEISTGRMSAQYESRSPRFFTSR